MDMQSECEMISCHSDTCESNRDINHFIKSRECLRGEYTTLNSFHYSIGYNFAEMKETGEAWLLLTNESKERIEAH